VRGQIKPIGINVLFAIILGAASGCDLPRIKNGTEAPKSITPLSYRVTSFVPMPYFTANGIPYAAVYVGHAKYTKQEDGSEKLEVYPSMLGNRIALNREYQSSDGSQVERVTVGTEWEITSLELPRVLVRSRDIVLERRLHYESHTIEFDEGDRLLADARRRYQERNW